MGTSFATGVHKPSDSLQDAFGITFSAELHTTPPPLPELSLHESGELCQQRYCAFPVSGKLRKKAQAIRATTTKDNILFLDIILYPPKAF